MEADDTATSRISAPLVKLTMVSGPSWAIELTKDMFGAAQRGAVLIAASESAGKPAAGVR